MGQGVHSPPAAGTGTAVDGAARPPVAASTLPDGGGRPVRGAQRLGGGRPRPDHGAPGRACWCSRCWRSRWRAAGPPGLATTSAERAAWPGPPRDAVAAEVQRVTDGDTFVATVDGRKERVRVIGDDTPETVAPNRPVEPYGRQASSFAERYLTGATVRLAGDAEPRDRYGRLLAYVWLADGTFWNALLVAEGYAQQLTIPPNVTYAGLFRRLVAEARRGDRGLWATSSDKVDNR